MSHNDTIISIEQLQNAIVQELVSLGLKPSVIPKKLDKILQVNKSGEGTGQVFRKPLNRLSSDYIDLQSGIRVEVPKFIASACTYISDNASVEGLFRKAGSNARQKEIRSWLDEGQKIDLAGHHVIDIANTLKYFMRELPDPLLPYPFHDLLLHCLLLEDVLGAALLVCLLLPRLHLHTLAYVMQVLNHVANLSEFNKMNHSNLAIVLAPAVMPLPEKLSTTGGSQRLNDHVRIVEILILNADKIGIVPEGVTDRLAITRSFPSMTSLNENHLSERPKKRRRRSASLTRMFNGLRKMVGGKTSPCPELNASESEISLLALTPDFSTPCVKSIKRKADDFPETGFSSKKKKDVLQSLPQATALADTPFKPSTSVSRGAGSSSRVCLNPNPKSSNREYCDPPKKQASRFFMGKSSNLEKSGIVQSSKKGILAVSSRLTKKQKSNSIGNGNFLERSWSAVSSSSTWKRKKQQNSDRTRLSSLSSSLCAPLDCDSSQDMEMGVDLSDEDSSSMNDFVQVSMKEYKELKCRMSAIETRISQEFSTVAESQKDDSPSANIASDVQTVYEKTLQEADLAKASSADQLAKRLSRELKIRRSTENKVIRSPSARKIGSLRRKSRERQSPTIRRELRRNKSWHMLQRPSSSLELSMPIQSSNLRRGRPNTVLTGLPHPSSNHRLSRNADECVEESGIKTRSQTRRASSVCDHVLSPRLSFDHAEESNRAKASSAVCHKDCDGNIPFESGWRDVRELLKIEKEVCNANVSTRRESIAKLRSENAGKVLATAKLFNANLELSKPSEICKVQAPSDKTAEVKKKAQFQNDLVSNGSVKPTGKGIRFAAHLQDFSASSSPRKTMNKQKSPRFSTRRQKPNLKPSPLAHVIMTDKEKKVNASKECVPLKDAAAGNKENYVDKTSPLLKPPSRGFSPQHPKDVGASTERIPRISISPLKDCNRIDVQVPPTVQTPKFSSASRSTTPVIKQPLSTRATRPVNLTPHNIKSRRVPTPLKAFNTPIQHIRSPHRPSPRHTQHIKPLRQITKHCK